MLDCQNTVVTAEKNENLLLHARVCIEINEDFLFVFTTAQKFIAGDFMESGSGDDCHLLRFDF